jgi:hypothetical protein
MSFIGKLTYERVKGKTSFVGRPIYRLTQPFGYILGQFKIECEEGFETDFASIPNLITFLRPENGKWRKASVIHDKACNMAAIKFLTYKQADVIFYYAMLDDEASKFTASFMYFWVRVNHLVVGKS